MQASKAPVDLSINFSWLIQNYFNSYQAMHKKPDLSKRAWVIKLSVFLSIQKHAVNITQYLNFEKKKSEEFRLLGIKWNASKKKNMTKNDLTLNYSNLIHLFTKYSRKYSPDNITATHLYSKLSELTFFDQLLTILLPSFPS